MINVETTIRRVHRFDAFTGSAWTEHVVSAEIAWPSGTQLMQLGTYETRAEAEAAAQKMHDAAKQAA